MATKTTQINTKLYSMQQEDAENEEGGQQNSEASCHLNCPRL